MKNNFTIMVALLTLILGFSSCEKDKDAEPNKSDIIVGKNWKMSAATISGQDVFMSFYDECERDNIVTFNKDGKYKEVEGTTKCNSSDPDTYEEGTWSISGDKLTFRMSGSAASFEADIVQLDNKTLKYSIVDPIFGSGQVYINTYTAQ